MIENEESVKHTKKCMLFGKTSGMDRKPSGVSSNFSSKLMCASYVWYNNVYTDYVYGTRANALFIKEIMDISR